MSQRHAQPSPVARQLAANPAISSGEPSRLGSAMQHDLVLRYRTAARGSARGARDGRRPPELRGHRGDRSTNRRIGGHPSRRRIRAIPLGGESTTEAKIRELFAPRDGGGLG